MEELDFTETARDEIYDPAFAQTCFEFMGKPESVEEGKSFFEHNQASDRMYLLLEGQVHLIRGARTLDTIKPGEIFWRDSGDIPHGPYEYPDGCEVFIDYMGDATHVWEKNGLLKHQNIWKPETD